MLNINVDGGRLNRDPFPDGNAADVDDEGRSRRLALVDRSATKFVQVLACGDDVGGGLVDFAHLPGGRHGQSPSARSDLRHVLYVPALGVDPEGGVDEVHAEERAELG